MINPLENSKSAAPPRLPADWSLTPVYSSRTLLVALVIVILLAVSAHRTEIDRMLVMSGEAVAVALNIKESSQVSKGLGRVATDLFPMRISEVRELARIENLDRDKLPWLAFIETRSFEESTLNINTLEMEKVVVE